VVKGKVGFFGVNTDCLIGRPPLHICNTRYRKNIYVRTPSRLAFSAVESLQEESELERATLLMR